VTLVSENASVQPGRSFYVGLRMRMRKGWHTYWKNPGDAGLPLRIEWKLPDGFSAGGIEWPAPERIPTGSLMSYGYSHEVLIPIEITPPDQIPADSVTIRGSFEWLECKEVCLPGSAALDLTRPVRSEPPPAGRDAPSFLETRSRMPRLPTGWSLSAEAGPRAISLAFRAAPGMSPRGAYLFVDQPLLVEYASPQGFERTGDGYRVTATPAPNAPGRPERLTGVLVVEDRAGTRARAAVKVDVPVSPGDPAPAREQSTRSSLPAPAYAVVLGFVGLGLALLLRGAVLARRRRERGTRSGESGIE
jgi:thiol:disulfide interchange protein DsbD